MTAGTDPLLSVFPPLLLRLVLCGGGGLPVAWGPLHRYDGAMCAWDPLAGRAHAHNQKACDPFMDLDGYLLLLNHWRPRLALVAAWILGIESRFAPWVSGIDGGMVGIAYVVADVAHRRWWDVRDGRCAGHGPDLPSLPHHLLTHDPTVALLLSLFDVPEIRAKVEAING